MTANEAIAGDLTKHHVEVLQVSQHLSQQANAAWASNYAELKKSLVLFSQFAGQAVDVETNAVAAAAFTKFRKKALNVRVAQSAKIGKQLQSAAGVLGATEPGVLAHILKHNLPVEVPVSVPSGLKTFGKGLAAQKYLGRDVKAWSESLVAADLQRIEAALRNSLASGGTYKQLLSAVGLASEGVYAQTQAVVRAITVGVTDRARKGVVDLNQFLDRELFVGTLDSRTTPICQSLDGKEFVVGEGPRPPLHVNCRSLRVPIVNGQVIGDRPSVPVTEKQLRGLKGKARRAAVEKLVGRTPARTTYQDWLAKQDAGFQDSVLGPVRAKLFRKGGLTLDKFVLADGRQLSLAELQGKYPAAFKAAGIGPGDIPGGGGGGGLPPLAPAPTPAPVPKPKPTPTAGTALDPVKIKESLAQQSRVQAVSRIEKFLDKGFGKSFPGQVPEQKPPKAKAAKAQAKALAAGQKTALAQQKAYEKAQLAAESKAAKAGLAEAMKKAKAQAKLDAAKQKALAAKKVPDPGALGVAPIKDLRLWTEVGSKPGGTVPGAMFQDEYGNQWVVKYPQSDDIARNEVLSAVLYRSLLGPESSAAVILVRQADGKLGVASRFIPGLRKMSAAQMQASPDVRGGFVVDAYLANWDTVGQVFDNIFENAQGRAVRVDMGGALRYRAQGGLKGSAFGDAVNELFTLRDPSKNPQTARVFKDLTDKDVKDQIEMLLLNPAMGDQSLRRLVDMYGPVSGTEQAQLLKTLIARREWLRRYIAPPPTSSSPGPARPTTTAGLDALKKVGATVRKAEKAPVPQLEFTFQNGFGRSVDQIGKDALKLRMAKRAGSIGGQVVPNIDSLTPAEVASVVEYSESGFNPVNRFLRGDTLRRLGDTRRPRKKLEEVAAMAVLLSAALKKLPTWTGELRRGTDLPQAVIDIYQPGVVVRETGFLSTSSASSGFTGDVQYHIKGATGRQMAALSTSYSEQEVLFDRGTDFFVEKVEKTPGPFGGVITNIYMREVLP